MSQPRRSARIAAKASASKASADSKASASKTANSKTWTREELLAFTVPFPQPKAPMVQPKAPMAQPKAPMAQPKAPSAQRKEENTNYTILTGAGYSGKSPLNCSFWSLMYCPMEKLFNMKNDNTLEMAILHHEMTHREDAQHAALTCSDIWEHEMEVAARWLCIDNRIIKESKAMREKAEGYAWQVNDLLPALYSKIECLKKQVMDLEGYEADVAHRSLLKAQLLLTLAQHVHEKWNIVMNEFNHENGITTCCQSNAVCGNQSCSGYEPFKPEMTPFDSDDEW